ncbi:MULTISPECIES: hypothetical protein [unclassified Sphingomonas]|uniref:hypothetical protein n=1 Tax=unclassified Sphingomonas TaxID=196159 RepID=UPI00226A97D8|nr:MULTISPECIES: hypothetical protein [unclassified Sphingomonas]
MAGISGATLGDDEFAFHFETPRGIDAQRLGVFLQRAAKVARDNGADLRIVAIEAGSLDVVARVTKATARKVGAEFAANPVKTTAASSVLVGVIVKGLAMVMSPAENGATPLAKAGAEIVEKDPVQSITIVSQGGQVIVMDPVIAGQVRRAERRYQAPGLPSYRETQRMIADGGELSGSVAEMDGDLYFRPDGHRFAVPIDMQTSEAADALYPGAHFRVRGELILRRDRPYALIVSSATRV